jgi:hypothetical protein
MGIRCQNLGMTVDSFMLCNGPESYYLYYNPIHSVLQSGLFLTSHFSFFISNLSREYQEILRIKQLCTALTAPCKNFCHRQSTALCSGGSEMQLVLHSETEVR